MSLVGYTAGLPCHTSPNHMGWAIQNEQFWYWWRNAYQLSVYLLWHIQWCHQTLWLEHNRTKDNPLHYRAGNFTK